MFSISCEYAKIYHDGPFRKIILIQYILLIIIMNCCEVDFCARTKFKIAFENKWNKCCNKVKRAMTQTIRTSQTVLLIAYNILKIMWTFSNQVDAHWIHFEMYKRKK